MSEKKNNETDTKRERFIRVAEKRVNNILDNLDMLGKCANKRNYGYSDQDVKKIFKEIDKKIREVKFLFEGIEENRKKFKIA